jgi:uncharacterized protein YdhG (YjbR/CyaY superfamily)
MTDKQTDEAALLQAIAAMPDHDRMISEHLHKVIMATVPSLMPRTWYGMPAYSNGSKIVLWFRSGKKFGERYITLGFNDVATLDEGNIWPISFAIVELTKDDETMIVALLKKATNESASERGL